MLRASPPQLLESAAGPKRATAVVWSCMSAADRCGDRFHRCRFSRVRRHERIGRRPRQGRINKAASTVALSVVASDLLARCHPAEQKLLVDICDQGTWRTRQIDPAPRTRGRGIPFMEALSDRAAIETSAEGTLVRLEWNGINRM